MQAIGLVDGLVGLLQAGDSLRTFKVNLASAYQPQEGEKDQGLLNNILGLMVINGMVEDQYVLRAVGAAIKLKPSELKEMIQAVQGKVAVNRSGQ